ncbi:unnamed protein product [Camellia sinensis]
MQKCIQSCLSEPVIFFPFSNFGLSARAGKGTLERELEVLSISAVACKNTGRCDCTLERILLRSSASQFVRTQFLVSPLERAVLSSSGDRGTDSINSRVGSDFKDDFSRSSFWFLGFISGDTLGVFL